jgi:hypothetical protein
VAMCYRSKVHSSTGFTPNFLMFGHERNDFRDFSNTPDGEIPPRLLEIQKLLNETQPEAIKNIEVVQEKQKKYQNARLNVSSDILPIGSFVLIKNEGILNKTDPRFSNKCIITGYDEFGNYLLKNMLNDNLEYGIPRQKLKPIPAEEERVETNQNEILAEVQKILDHRVDGNKNEYLVKWRYIKDPEWISEDKFETKEIISRYWKQQNKEKEKKTPAKRGRGRPPKNKYLFLHILVVVKI